MNQCKICSKECAGNTCSGSCRAKLSRQSKTLEHQDGAQIQRTRTVEPEAHAPSARKAHGEAVTPPPPAVIKRVAGAIQAAIDGHSATRTNPDLINHGQPLSTHGLKKAGLKANRVPIPGDHDYTGVCEYWDDKWQVVS